MTEQEWLRCEDPRLLFDFLFPIRKRVEEDPRKLSLFAIACCRTAPVASEDAARIAKAKLTVAEWFADHEVSVEEVRCFWPARDFLGWVTTWPETPRDWAGSYRACESYPTLVEKLAFLRCLFGNPFRPVSFDPSWLTPTVTTLAQQMYDTRDFSAMAILADALEDASCADEQVLGHCRGSGPHARGCWVVDLILSKV